MNFLAHLYLAGDSEPIIIGNFIGDFVKGRLNQQYPPEIMNGIALHRNIDFFTDNHPVVIESKKRLRLKYRHYAGVLVDMYYDHLLASNWAKYAQESLEAFTQNSYDLLNSHVHTFPPKAQLMFPHMMNGNWLLNYRHLEGIEQALKGMSRRSKYPSGIETGVVELQYYYEEFENEFNIFFPSLIKFAKEVRDNFKAS